MERLERLERASVFRLGRLKLWKAAGYHVQIIYLRISSPQITLRRIAVRVNKAATMCHAEMCCAASLAVGIICKSLSSFSRCVERV